MRKPELNKWIDTTIYVNKNHYIGDNPQPAIDWEYHTHHIMIHLTNRDFHQTDMWIVTCHSHYSGVTAGHAFFQITLSLPITAPLQSAKAAALSVVRDRFSEISKSI